MKKKSQVFIAVGFVIAVIAFIFSLQLTSWFYSINTRVRLYLDAPAATKINICWDEKRLECLPLVPTLSPNNQAAKMDEMADVWLSELPPRPAYFISLQFKSGVTQANFHLLELDSSKIFLQGYGKENGAGVNNLRLGIDKFELSGIAPVIGSPGVIESQNNGFLVHKEEIASGPSDDSRGWSTTLFIWGIIFSFYLWVALPVYLLPDAIQNLGSANRLIPLQKYPWLIYLACVAIGIGMVAFVVKSGVIIHQYDPLHYLLLTTDKVWFNGSRLPGYPLFLALAFFISGYDLDGVILLQAGMLALSVLFCLWTLRKWISPYVALPFVVFTLFSPVQINFARWILRESVFASLVVLGVAAVIAHFTSRKPFSQLWLLFFALLCGMAFLVRENGVILPLALLPVLTAEIIKRLVSPGTIPARVRSILGLLPLYSLPFVAIAAVYIGFSTYNYQRFGFFQMEEQQTSHGYLSRAMSPANFDARGLLKPMTAMSTEAQEYLGWSIYSSYILSRDQHYGHDQTYAAFYPTIDKLMVERGMPASQFHQASLLNEIGKSVAVLIPWRAVVAGELRQYIFVLNPTQRYPLNEIDISKAPVFLKALPVTISINTEKKSLETENFLNRYYNTTMRYKWYVVLFTLALVATFYISKYEDIVFLTPMAVYMANCCLVLYSRMVDARVFANIDVMLVLQIALGLSLWLYRKSHLNSQEAKL